VNRAVERLLAHLDHRTGRHKEQFLVDERIGNGDTRTGQDPRKRRPRHPHPLRCRLVVQPLQICQPERLEFVEPQRHRQVDPCDRHNVLVALDQAGAADRH